MRNSRISIDFRSEKDKKVKSFTGITLGRNDIIKVGVYGTHRMKVSTVLARYGKKGVKELLNHYDLEEDILLEYHLLHKTNEKEQDRQDFVQEILSLSFPVEKTFVKTTTQVGKEYHDQGQYDEYENDLDCYDNSEDNEFGPLWGPGSKYKPWIYG